MASKKPIFLIPPTSINKRWATATESELLEAIHGIYRHIMDKSQQYDVAIQSNVYGWVVSPTLNGAVPDRFIFSSSCIRSELIFLCIFYACSVCWSVHKALVESQALNPQQYRGFFRRMRSVYLILRDVAKPQILKWTANPQIPPVAECSMDTVDLLLSLCVSIYSLAVCLFSNQGSEKVEKHLWARMTLFVAERFESTYTILHNQIWPMYGCQHPSAWEMSVVLAGYCLYYRGKSYASLLHDPDYLATLQNREIIALARCTEYLMLPLTDPMFGFAGERLQKYIDDMREIVKQHLPVCESPMVGIQRIETGEEFDSLFKLVADSGKLPESQNLVMMMFKKNEKAYFIPDPSYGNYNITSHSSASTKIHLSGARKARFHMSDADK
jgi:hypothetical protein